MMSPRAQSGLHNDPFLVWPEASVTSPFTPRIPQYDMRPLSFGVQKRLLQASFFVAFAR
jgi:hypothetical protein